MKTEQGWTFIRHPLDKALKDTQHTVFLIQVLFPEPLPHAGSMLLATVGGAAERSLVPRGFHVRAGRRAAPRPEPGLFYFHIISQEASAGSRMRGERTKQAKLAKLSHECVDSFLTYEALYLDTLIFTGIQAAALVGRDQSHTPGVHICAQFEQR